MPSPGLCSLRSEGKNPRSASRSRPAGREIPRSAALSVGHFFPKMFKVQKVITPENLRSASRSRPAGRELPRSAALSVGHFFPKIFKVQKVITAENLRSASPSRPAGREIPRSAALSVGGHFFSKKCSKSKKKKKKKLLTHYHRSKALVETDISITSPGRGPSETSSWLFFFFFFDRAIFTRKTCTGVSSTLCENFGPIRPRVVAQSGKNRLPAPLFAIFRLSWPLSDEEKTFSPSSGNFRQRGTEISSISPGFPTRLVHPKKKEPTS